MLPEQKQRITGYFILEARDHLCTIEQGLLNLQSTIEDPERVNELLRAARLIKGGAAMLEISSIQKVAQALEKGFQILREYFVRVDQKLKSTLLKVFAALEALFAQLSEPFGLSEAVANQMVLEMEPIVEQLYHHLEWLVHQVRLIPSHVKIRATSDTERIYLSGYCTLQATERIVNRFRGTITHRNWEEADSNEQPSIEIDIRFDMRLPALTKLEALRASVESAGGIVETIRIETLQTCRGCLYYHGQCGIVCAVHPNGPEEERCRDWESRNC